MKKWIEALRPNPFEKLLRKVAAENKRRFLVVWNRGLGDIPLGLYALVHRIRSFIPRASVIFLTRKDLADAFSMLEEVQVIVGENWERGKPIAIDETLKKHDLSPNMFDVILEKPDPTRWLKWQLGTLTPKLRWNEAWDTLVDRYELDPKETYIGCHVQSETAELYGYKKDW
ncbi:MAG: hypothetical protein KDK60_02315, partial [Chlamydiia bacterium]|nr:hypothetical protein [Chlamydiia bacterium]